MTLDKGGQGVRKGRFEALVGRYLPYVEESQPTVTVFLRGIAQTSEGYLEVWDRFIQALREVQQHLVHGLGEMPEPAPGPEGLGDFIEYLESIRGDARHRLMSLGVVMGTPLERALRKACAVSRGRPQDNFRNEEVRDFLQGLYDQRQVASNVIQELITILRGDEASDPREIQFLIRALEAVAPSDAAKRLSHRGVRIHNGASASQQGRFQKGDSERGRQGREVSLRKRIRLSRMKLEELRIKETNERHYPYAGRRIDIEDAQGHHPFITSLPAANFARHLSGAKRRWLYRPRGLFLEGENGGYLEPDFFLVDEKISVILADRNSLKKRRPRSFQDLEKIRDAHPELHLEIVDENEHSKGPEYFESVISIKKRIQRKRFGRVERFQTKVQKSIAGPNVKTHPQRFLMPTEECPCSLCTGKRMGEAPLPRGGFPIRRKRK